MGAVKKKRLTNFFLRGSKKFMGGRGPKIVFLGLERPGTDCGTKRTNERPQ